MVMRPRPSGTCGKSSLARIPQLREAYHDEIRKITGVGHRLEYQLARQEEAVAREAQQADRRRAAIDGSAELGGRRCAGGSERGTGNSNADASRSTPPEAA